MANPDPGQCGSKDDVSLKSVVENKGDVDDKNGNTAAESVSHITEKVKKKQRRSSRRKARVSSAIAPKPAAPQINREANVEPPSLQVPQGAEAGVATPLTYLTSNFIFYKGNYWKSGDVVAIMNEELGLYYAQIRKFVTYENFEKGALITWLFPTSPHTPMDFDPSAYMIGPEEDSPRILENMHFVMHLPIDYYTNRKNPTPPTDAEINRDFG